MEDEEKNWLNTPFLETCICPDPAKSCTQTEARRTCSSGIKNRFWDSGKEIKMFKSISDHAEQASAKWYL